MFNRIGYVETTLGKRIQKQNHPKLTRQQLFNYLIQAYETETNMQVVKELNEYLEDKQSTLILYVYDSFLFDFSKSDGKETLIKIKEIVSKKHPIKMKIGKNYDVLEAL
jgi:ribosomal protein S24E